MKLGKLGDGILALGAIRVLVEHFGEDQCAIVASSFFSDLIKSEFPLAEVISVTTNHSTLRRTLGDLHRHRNHRLFRFGADALVSLQYHRTLHDDVIAASIPAKAKWGLANSELGMFGLSDQIASTTFAFDNSTEAPASDPSICRELSLHASLVSAVVGREILAKDLRPRISPRHVAEAPVIGLAPFSGSPLRDVPRALLVGACRKAGALGFRIRIWAPSASDLRTLDIKAYLEDAAEAEIEVVHTPTTQSLIDAIAKAALVVAAESAPAHIAAALDRPLVAIIGGGHFGWFAPWTNSDRQRWLTSKQVCFSCNWRCVHTEAICITRIEEGTFRRAIDEALAA